MRRAVPLVLDNLRTLLFLAGFTLLYVGLSGWSLHVANVTAGGLLMVLAILPYLRRAK